MIFDGKVSCVMSVIKMIYGKTVGLTMTTLPTLR